MFADNDRISARQLKRQMVLTFLGPLILFQAGDTAAGGGNALLSLLLGTVLLTAWVFLLTGTAEVWAAPEQFLGIPGKWVWAAVSLSFLGLSGSVLLEQITGAVQRYLLSSLPRPVLGAAFLGAAFLGMGRSIQRRGRLAELCYPWILGIFCLLFLLGAAHFRGVDLASLGPLEADRICGGTVRLFALGMAFCLLPMSLVRVRGEKDVFPVLRRGIWLLLLVTLGAAAVLLGVYGRKGVEELEYPILHLMTGTSLPGGFTGRFEIIWLAVLLFAMLFTLGSMLSCGGRICGEKSAGFRGSLLLGLAMWLGSFLQWEGEALSRFYYQLIRDIYLPLFLGMGLLAVWVKRRSGNEKKNEEQEAG